MDRRIPVVLVHGWSSAPDAFGPEDPVSGLPGLGRVLADAGSTVAAPFDYADATPRKAPWPASIPELAGALAAHLADVRADASAAEVDLVCHSMGGLLARAYMAGLAIDADRRPVPYAGDVRRVVLVATPNYGTRDLRGGRGRRARQLRSMAADSTLLLKLHDAWRSALAAGAVAEADVLTVAGIAGAGIDGDGVVLPASAALPAPFLSDPAEQVRLLPLLHSGPGGLVFVTASAHPLVPLVEAFLRDEPVPASWSPSQELRPGTLVVVRLVRAPGGRSRALSPRRVRIDGAKGRRGNRSTDERTARAVSRAATTFLLDAADGTAVMTFRLPRGYRPAPAVSIDRGAGLPVVVDVPLVRRRR